MENLIVLKLINQRTNANGEKYVYQYRIDYPKISTKNKKDIKYVILVIAPLFSKIFNVEF